MDKVNKLNTQIIYIKRNGTDLNDVFTKRGDTWANSNSA